MLRSVAWLTVIWLAAGSAIALERTPAPAGARVYVISPADGSTVPSPVTVVFGLEGMGVAPAGVEVEGTGHHHLIIGAEPPPFDEPIPSDDTHWHFGGGQTQTTIELPPGEHTLRLLLADHNHIAHEPPVMSEPITVTVQ